MELLLQEDQRLIQDSMVRLCAGLGGPARMRAMAGTQGEVDAQAMSQLQEAGWLKLLCPESAGGWGLGRKIKRLVAAKFPNESTKGLALYGFLRSTQMRRMRAPKPNVKRGDKNF